MWKRYNQSATQPLSQSATESSRQTSKQASSQKVGWKHQVANNGGFLPKSKPNKNNTLLKAKVFPPTRLKLGFSGHFFASFHKNFTGLLTASKHQNNHKYNNNNNHYNNNNSDNTYNKHKTLINFIIVWDLLTLSQTLSCK